MGGDGIFSERGNPDYPKNAEVRPAGGKVGIPEWIFLCCLPLLLSGILFREFQKRKQRDSDKPGYPFPSTIPGDAAGPLNSENDEGPLGGGAGGGVSSLQ